MNWKIRFKDPVFLGQLFLAIATPVGVVFGVTGADMSSWTILFDTVMKTLSNPAVLATITINIVAVVRDPTTKGFGDSKDVLELEKVYED